MKKIKEQLNRIASNGLVLSVIGGLVVECLAMASHLLAG